MSTKKLDEDSITLDEYSTFQYMLSPPTNTKKITDQITSFVFYNKPYYEEKEDVIESKNIIVEGEVTCINYFCCCLILLPSHILGMSKWISAEDYYNQSSSSSSEHSINLKSGDILRRFRYTFYCNLLLVETHHICVESHNERGVGKEVHPKKFRLVEYMTCPISLWLVANTVFTLAAFLISYSLHFACGFNGSTSFAILIVSVLACFHFILLLTGVRMW